MDKCSSLIYILSCVNDVELADEIFLKHLSGLPIGMQEKSKSYVHWKDRQAFVYGRLLLVKGLNLLRSGYSLGQLKETEFHRPYFDQEIDFNISHSGHYVVCAIAQSCRVGIDIEKISNIDFTLFEGQFNSTEWGQINTSKNKHVEFFRFWTQKEAIVKAHGMGLSFPLQQICINDDLSVLEGRDWYLYEINIDRHYMAHLATSSEKPRIELVKEYF